MSQNPQRGCDGMVFPMSKEGCDWARRPFRSSEKRSGIPDRPANVRPGLIAFAYDHLEPRPRGRQRIRGPQLAEPAADRPVTSLRQLPDAEAPGAPRAEALLQPSAHQGAKDRGR